MSICITDHEDLDTILGRFVGDVHSEWTSTSECKQLLIHRDNRARLVALNTILHKSRPKNSDMGKRIIWQAGKPSILVIKPDSPYQELKPPLRKEGSVEGTAIHRGKHVTRSQVVVLPNT